MTEIVAPSLSLTDGVVLLRRWREADLPAIAAASTDPAIRQSSPASTLSGPDAAARRYLADQEQERRAGTGLQLAIVDPEDAALYGGCSVYDVDRDQATASTGYWLAANARGRGHASRAVRLLAGWAFDQLALARIELTCGPDNVASQRVAERCGFVREGVLRSHIPFKGGRRDSVVYGLLPGELR